MLKKLVGFPWIKWEMMKPREIRPQKVMPQAFTVRLRSHTLHNPLRSHSAPDLADFEERFRTAPVGTWGEAHDSEFVGDIWKFNADHTGKVEQTNFPGTVSSEVLFEWKRNLRLHHRD